MTNVNATEHTISPSANYGSAYVTGAKAAQNDTLTCLGFRVIYTASGHVEPSSGDWAAETITRESTSGSENVLNLTGSAVGTFHGYVVGQLA